MITSKTSLLDTNVLVYAADESSPFFDRSRNLLERGLAGESDLCVSLQNLSEFFAIVTDSKRVANPRSQEEALEEVKKYLQSGRIGKIYQGPATGEAMLDLMQRYPIKRQEIFDLQLVATMLSNQVSRIYTYNRDDFLKFTELEVLEP